MLGLMYLPDLQKGKFLIENNMFYVGCHKPNITFLISSGLGQALHPHRRSLMNLQLHKQNLLLGWDEYIMIDYEFVLVQK